MGFTDTMKGVGRALGGLLETGIETLGPPLMQMGAQALVNKVFPNQQPQFGSYQPRYGTLPQPQSYRQPQQYAPQQYSAPGAGYILPEPQRLPYLPFGATNQAVPYSWTPITPARTATPQPAYGGGYAPAVYSPASGIGSAVGSIYDYFTGDTSMPAFPTTTFQGAPGTQGGGLGGELMERLRGAAGGLPTMYRYGGQRITPVREIQAQNPETGKIGVWKYMGRPILYTGDLAACKRVSRVARRVARRRPR